MRSRRNLRRKAISVMFMTFIAISILTTVFLTMYLYLLRASTMASEAERLYAEAAQEKLKVIYYESENNLTATNEGGVSVFIKYVIEIDKQSGKAYLTEWSSLDPADQPSALSPGESAWKTYPKKSDTSEQIAIVTERGSIFLARPPVSGGSATSLLTATLQYDLLSIPPGKSATDIITIQASESYPGGEVYLTRLYTSIWDFRISVSYNPEELSLDPGEQGASTMRIAVSSLTPYDRYTIVTLITGAGGTTTFTSLTLLVGDFTLSFNQSRLDMKAGETGTVEVILQSDNYESSFQLSVTDCPTGWTCTLDDTSLYLDKDSAASTILHVTAPKSADAGTYYVTVEAVDERTGYSKSATLTVVISSGGGQACFTITLSQNAIIIPPGGTGRIDVTVSSNGTYSGRVALRAENTPAGTSFKFNPRKVKVKPGSPGVSKLTITVSRNAQPGTYWVRIVGRDTKTGEESSTLLRLIIFELPRPPPGPPLPPIPPPQPIQPILRAGSL